MIKADIVAKQINRKRFVWVQSEVVRRVISSYHTVSEAAVLIIAGIIAVALLVRERKQTPLGNEKLDR